MRDLYIAGLWEAQARLKVERDWIQSRGVGRVVGTWLDATSTGSLADQGRAAESREYANRDLQEVMLADLFILDTLDENYRGGREVEYGAALAWDKEVWVVGPQRNVFHSLACVFESWSLVRIALAKEYSDAKRVAA